MPELPEVETVMRGLTPVMAGRIIHRVTANRPDLRIPFPKNLRKDIENHTCLALRRRGKYIWADFDNGKTLVIHLGMSGSFTINPRIPAKHDHVTFTTGDGDNLVYNDPRRFGMMFFVDTDREHLHPAFTAMGPEPLGNDFHAQSLIDGLKQKKSAIKVALLDQSLVAGIGNIYACEALYMAGIDPTRQANTITLHEAENLVTAIRAVLHAAIESGGSTLRDHRQTDGKMGYFQHQFAVYDRTGEICPKTGGVIKRIVQAGRSTFYCPEKQR